MNDMMEELNKLKICNVLLVEDDEDDFYIFNMAVSSLKGSFQLLRTSNGIMFSSLIQTSIVPDVIFLDINMPYKNGISCLKEIRSNRAFDETRVVIYSGAIQKREVDICYDLGANFYLIKPTDFSLTKRQLRDLLQNEYFKLNVQPSRDEFVMNYKNGCNKESEKKLVV
jgi:CheY-like chemotaxis protein